VGTADLVLAQLLVVDDEGRNFAVATEGPLALAAGGSATVAILLTPRLVGALTGRLVAVAADGTQHALADLVGTGTHWLLEGSIATRGPPAGEALNHTLRFTDGAVELVSADGTVDAIALAGLTGISLAGGSLDDTLRVELTGDAPVGIVFDGGAGTDTLAGPGGPRTWTVDGAGAGTVGGLRFAGVENLLGAAGNDDTFVFEGAGSLAGVAHGGDGGWDTLVLASGDFARVVYEITGAQSGTIARDGDLLAYDGLEPIEDDTPGAKVVNGSVLGDDVLTIRDAGGALEVAPAVGEKHVFSNASSITVNGFGGSDRFVIESLPAGPTLILDGGSGTDSVETPRAGVVLPTTTLVGVERASVSFLRDVLDLLDAELTGVTVVTHGWQLPVVAEGDGMMSIASAIQAVAAGAIGADKAWLVDYDLRGDGETGFIDLTQSDLPTTSGLTGEVVFLYDWADESNERAPGWAEAAADALFAILVDLGFVTPAAPSTSPALHFIAHSMGTAVTSDVIERLAAFDVPVDHVTYLDPHDFDQEILGYDSEMKLWQLGAPEDYGVTVWENVAFADVYYQTRGTKDGVGNALVPNGRPIPGAYNYWLNDLRLPGPDTVNDHSWVWEGFYLATIENSIAGTSGSIDLTKGYAFSRLAGRSTRPQPTFYGSRTQATDPQDHTYSSPTLVHTDTGLPNQDGLASLDLTATAVTNAAFRPAHDTLGIVNGGFEQEATGAGGSVFSEIQPGWSHHAGGGSGHVDVEANGNHYLELDAGDESRAHNLFYVPT
ncbi:MAG TPA: hypothetical protein VF044_07060, partial [Actinomycetota bacterium]